MSKTPRRSWQETTLGKVLTLQRGFDITKAQQHPGPYRVISSSGTQSTHAEYKVMGPGVVIGRKGTLGSVYFSKEPFWPHDTTLWVKDFHGNDEKFAYYFLQTLHLGRYDAGASNPTINRNHIHLLPVVCPPLPTQRRIAAILSAYDDLIENNARRIKILEEMARLLYREWFVHFRFPWHEGVRMLDGVPEGWEVKTFGEVSLNFDSKRKPLSSLQRATMQGEYPYYGAAKVLDYINDYIFDGEYLLVAEDGSVITPPGNPVLQLVDCRFWPNNHTHVIQGKPPVSTQFLYLSLSGLSISGYITGAAQPKITQASLNRIPVLVPADTGLLSQFDEIARNMLTRVKVLERENANLRWTRDLLLPRLVAGELDVSDVDIVGVLSP